MLYAMAFLIIFSIGGLTGIFLGALSTDIHLHDTYFVVAHFHAVMMGSTAIAFFAGVSTTGGRRCSGRIYNETLAKISAVLILERVHGHVPAAVHDGQPGHAAPLRDVPARVATLPPGVDDRRVHRSAWASR